MKTRFTLLFSVFFLILSTASDLYSQNVTRSNSSGRVKWGINIGATYLKSDIKDRAGVGWGSTLEWAFLQNDHTWLGLSMRGRYLAGNAYGKNYMPSNTASIQNSSALNGTFDPSINYVSTPGFAYENYKTKFSEWTFEGMLTANRLRARHGILLYGFAGIGTTGYKTFTDQKNDLTGQQYDYTSITTDTKQGTLNQLNTLRDGQYETPVQTKMPKWVLAPSCGIGLGFMIGKYVSFGVEHKITFSNTDMMDGKKAINHNGLTPKSDIYHYTSCGFTFTLGDGSGSANHSSNPNNYNTSYTNTYTTPVLPAPVINTTNPTSIPAYPHDCRADIQAIIDNINSVQDIDVYINGTRLSTEFYYYNTYSKIFHLNFPFTNTATFNITARNTTGSSSKEYSFVCSSGEIKIPPVAKKPQIIIYSPTQNPSTSADCYAGIFAKIYNIDNSTNIQVTQNGQMLSSQLYTYNVNTKEFSLNSHINGVSVFVIRAFNSAGDFTSTVTFNCQPPVITKPTMVTICHVPAGDPTHPVTITIDNVNLSEHLSHGDHLGTCPIINTSPVNCSTLKAVINPPANLVCNGASNGSLNLAVSGGKSPYTYRWSNGANSQNLSNLVAGNYSVTVTDANRCVTIATAIIAEPSPLVVITNGTPSCQGSGTGTAFANITGGTAPYSYKWSNGALTQSVNNLIAGTYTLVVTDARGCSAPSSVNIFQSEAIKLNPVVKNLNCNGNNSGSINLIPAGGTPPYVFKWSNAAESSSLTNLAAGSYSVTVTDAKNCMTTTTATITEFSALTATSSVYGNNAHIIATGGTPPYTYNWQPGNLNEASQNKLANGTYTVLVTDANKCTVRVLVNINNADNNKCVGFTAAITSPSQLTCGGSKNGSINLNITGGTAPYIYNWSNGSTTQDIANLTAGNYSVIVTDANQCIATATATISEPSALTVSVNNSLSCKSSNTGTASVNVSGGLAPYSYKWAHGAMTQSLTNLAPGTYTVTVTDANNCTALSATTIKQSSAINASLNSTPVTCHGNNDGSITLSVAGGSSPYTYNWSNGATSPNLTNLPAGSYNLTITDDQNCTATASAIVTEPPALTATSNVNENTGTVTATGGKAPYVFSWSPGNMSEATQSNLSNGNYTVNITDANKCQTTVSVLINNNKDNCTGFNATISSKINELCNEGNNGAINLSVTGGKTPYTYKWNNGITTQDLSNLIAGNYIVTVTDGNGCTTTASATITDPPSLIVTGSSTPACPGLKMGTASVSVSGGTSPYAYKWNNGSSSPVINNVEAGIYSITVTDINNCKATASVIIHQTPSINALANVSNVNCNGDHSGSINLSVNGGSSPFTYSWSNGANNQNLTGLSAGVYNVTVTDEKNCTAVASATITEPSVLTATSSVNGKNAAITATGGTSPYSYKWQPGNLTGNSQNNLANGNYNVIVTDTKNCTANTTVAINNDNCTGFGAIISSKTNPTCFGTNNGSVNLTVSGGASPYIYKWSNGAITQDLSNVGADNYSVSVTDANACIASASASLTASPAITVTATGTASCINSSTGSATANVSGGSSPYSFKWSNGASSQSINNLSAGTYTVTVTDENRCNGTATVNISQTSTLKAIVNTTNILCEGNNNGSINLSVSGGTAPYTYSWSNGASSQDLSNLTAGTYNVTVTDDKNCSATTTAIITSPSALTGSANVNGRNATISANGGKTPYSYSWQPGNLSGPTQSNLSNGTYTVTISDANSCTSVVTAVINVVPEEKITICHKTNDNNSNTIQILTSELSSHLAHGDQVGTCPVKENPVPEETVSICHIPPGNPDHPVNITIPKSALPAHLAHGDQLGTCPVEEEKITICHIPPGNPENAHSISIPKSALPAHLAHGDHVGECTVQDNKEDNEKITICHIPPGNTDNPQSITISKSALAAHLAHGDHVGECTVQDNKEDNEKITICHIPPGNTDNPQSITISKSALAAHLAHGDHVGECTVQDNKEDNEKITICHIPPGNTDNPQSITISKSALAAHLAHGDHVGECTVQDNKEDNEKITICHIPPGNTDNPQSITISKSALAAHLAHGDHVGECTSQDNKEDNEKITICHIPPGNTDNPQSITISKSALAAHLAHGDHIGDCNSQDEKITICHIPPGNTDNPQSITISKSALPAHLAHGDHVGECTSQDNKNNNPDNGTDKNTGTGNNNSNDNKQKEEQQRQDDELRQQHEKDVKDQAEKDRQAKLEQQRQQELQQQEADRQAQLQRQKEQAEKDKQANEEQQRQKQQSDQTQLEEERKQQAEKQRQEDELRQQHERDVQAQAERDRLAQQELERKQQLEKQQADQREQLERQQEQQKQQQADQQKQQDELRQQHEREIQEQAEKDRQALQEQQRQQQLQQQQEQQRQQQLQQQRDLEKQEQLRKQQEQQRQDELRQQHEREIQEQAEKDRKEQERQQQEKEKLEKEKQDDTPKE